MTNPIEELKRLEQAKIDLRTMNNSYFWETYGPDYRQIALDLAADYLAFAEQVYDDIHDWIHHVPNTVKIYGTFPETKKSITAKITALRSITDPGRRQNHGF